MKKILFVLFLVTGFLFFFGFTPKTEAFKITMLSKIPGQRIVKDYRIFTYDGEFFEINGVIHPHITSDDSLNVNFTKFIINNAPSGANACVSLRFGSPRSSIVYCQYVKLIPKK